jgi:murein L,D-transpeptidase YcbB/YkuD
VLAATPAQAAPTAHQAAPDQAPAVPEAALAAAVCASWTDYVTTPGVRYNVRIPSTTRNGNQANCVLYNGISSDGVYKLQDALNRCYGHSLAVDGDFGSATESAVRDVQRRHRITVDGVYGQNTRAAMTWPKYLNGSFHHC